MTQDFTIGDKVRLVALPPYFKTAEPMPMLRPQNVVRLGETGVILDRRPGNFWSVRFKRGAYLLDSQYLELESADTNDPESSKHVSDIAPTPLINLELPQDS